MNGEFLQILGIHLNNIFVKIETTHKEINAAPKEIYNFLMDTNNFEQLFPQDKISEWESTTETCSMKVQNMGVLGLKRVASTPNSLVYFDSFGKTPFKFTFNIFLEEKENKCLAKIVFEGNVNPFMKMMVEKPLTGFMNGLSDKLSEIHA